MAEVETGVAVVVTEVETEVDTVAKDVDHDQMATRLPSMLMTRPLFPHYPENSIPLKLWHAQCQNDTVSTRHNDMYILSASFLFPTPVLSAAAVLFFVSLHAHSS